MTAFRPLTAHESYVHALRSEFADCPRRVPTCVTNHDAAVQWCSDVVEAIVIPRGDEPTLYSAIPRAIVAARGALHARGARRTWVTVSDHSARDPGDFHDDTRARDLRELCAMHGAKTCGTARVNASSRMAVGDLFDDRLRSLVDQHDGPLLRRLRGLPSGVA